MRSSLVPAALFALFAHAAPCPAQKVYKDPKYGFTFKIPRDFNRVPVNMDEKWVVAKFLYKRPLEGKIDFIQMTPEIRVIIFPKFDPKDFSKRRIKTKKGRRTVIQLLENPYRNYKEFLRENYNKGGWHVAEEKETKIGKFPAVYKKILVNQKLRGSDNISNVIEAWEIDFQDATYVLQFEVLADYAHKFRTAIKKASKSFKMIPRTEALKTPTSTAGSVEVTYGKKGKSATKTPEERRRERIEELERIKEKARTTLPEGWSFFKKGPFLILQNKKVDKRFANRVAKQANLVWKWLHENLDYIGEDFAVGAVIRICNSAAEANAYIDTSGKSAYSARSREIVIYKDRDFGFAENSWRMNVGLAQRFLADKNMRLWYSLPPWLDDGFVYFIGNLKMKGSRLLPKPDEWDMEILRDRLRKNEFKKAREIVTSKYGKSYNSLNDRVQSLAINHFLMTKGKKHKKYRNIIPDYLGTLDRRIRQLEKEWRRALEEARREAEKSKKKDGDDEDEEKRAWYTKWKEKRNKIYEECLKEVFGSWTEKDWENFDKDWKRAFKKG